MNASSREPLLGLAAGIGVLLIFSGFLVTARFGATKALTIYDMAALRYGVAGILTIPVMLRIGIPRMPWRQAITIAICSGPPFVLFAFAGMTYAPVAHGGVVINGAMPIFAAFTTWLIFGEGLGRWRIAGIALIVCGVLATGWDALAFGEPGQWRGHLLFLACAATNSTFLVAVRGWRIPALHTLIVVNGLNLLIYVPLWLLALPSNIANAPWQEIAVQGIYQGFVAAFIASILIAYAARTLGGTKQAAVMSGAPAVAALAAIPVLGEIPSWISVAGIFVVTAGILVTLGPGLIGGRTPAPPEPEPEPEEAGTA